jgi:ribosomal protein L12E/L44/L45/RPP1/RPP2
MKALIAFAVMALVILTLIEINERIKAKRGTTSPAPPAKAGEGQDKEKHAASEEAACDDPEDEDCSACELIAVCEKKDKGESKSPATNPQ